MTDEDIDAVEQVFASGVVPPTLAQSAAAIIAELRIWRATMRACYENPNIGGHGCFQCLYAAGKHVATVGLRVVTSRPYADVPIALKDKDRLHRGLQPCCPEHLGEGVRFR